MLRRGAGSLDEGVHCARQATEQGRAAITYGVWRVAKALSVPSHGSPPPRLLQPPQDDRNALFRFHGTHFVFIIYMTTISPRRDEPQSQVASTPRWEGEGEGEEVCGRWGNGVEANLSFLLSKLSEGQN